MFAIVVFIFFCRGLDIRVPLRYNLKFGKEPAQSLEIWALSRFVYIGYTVLFGGKLKKIFSSVTNAGFAVACGIYCPVPYGTLRHRLEGFHRNI